MLAPKRITARRSTKIRIAQRAGRAKSRIRPPLKKAPPHCGDGKPAGTIFTRTGTTHWAFVKPLRLCDRATAAMQAADATRDRLVVTDG